MRSPSSTAAGSDAHASVAAGVHAFVVDRAAGEALSAIRRLLSTLPWWCWILLVVAVEAVVVLIVAPTPWSKATLGDGAEYQRYASNLLHHGVFSESPVAPYYPQLFRDPGYPAFLAAVEWIGGAHVLPVEVAQFGVLAAIAVLVGLIGREVATPTIANLAALLCATYLPFLGLAGQFLTEPLSALLLTLIVYLLVRAVRSHDIRIVAVLGLVFAALTYVRAESAILAAPVALMLLLSRPAPWGSARRWSAPLVFVLVFLLPLVPWTIRNASVTGGRFVPLAANSGSTLLASADQYDGLMSDESDTQDTERWDAQIARIIGSPATAVHGIQVSEEYATALREIKVNDEEQAAAVKIFKTISVGMVIRHLPNRVLWLWTTGDEVPLGTVSHRIAELQYAALTLLILIGVVVRRRRLLADWPLWIGAVYLTLIHLIFNVEGRFTLPARPALMVYAAAGAVALTSRLARGRLQSLRSAPSQPGRTV